MPPPFDAPIRPYAGGDCPCCDTDNPCAGEHAPLEVPARMCCVVFSNCDFINGLTFDFTFSPCGAGSAIACVPLPFMQYQPGIVTSGCVPAETYLSFGCLHGLAECADMMLDPYHTCVSISIAGPGGPGTPCFIDEVWDDPGGFIPPITNSALQRQGTSPQTWLTYTATIPTRDVFGNRTCIPCLRVDPDASAPFIECELENITLQFLFTAC